MARQRNRILFLQFMFIVIFTSTECSNFESVPRYDGWYNNLDRKDWGSAGHLLRRSVLSEYSDFTYQPSGENRPGPRQLSNDVFKGDSGLPSYNNKTALFVFFGQMISYEMVHANSPTCPVELIKLDVPKGDPDFDPENEGGKHIPFYRSEYDKQSGQSPNNPRRQLNKVSSWIDGSFVYGSSRVWADTLRSFTGGRLKTYKNTTFPAWNNQSLPMINHPSSYDNTVRDPTTLWMLGNPFVHENPGLLSIALVWYMYHNHLADQYANSHPGWNDEQIYRQARKMTVATLQNIVVYEWLPILLGEDITSYDGYKSEVEPDISVLFESAAFRQLATMVPPGIYIRDEKCKYRSNSTALRLCNTFYKSQELIEELDVESFLMGMSSQVAEREDNIVVQDIRGKNVGSLQFSRLDYVASTIMRGRDHGLPDYNQVRKEFGLPPIQDWSDINRNIGVNDSWCIHEVHRLYNGSMDEIDYFVAGLIESGFDQMKDSTFSEIIKDQFQRVRDGDRFWFENKDGGWLLNDTEISEIKAIKFKDVIVKATGINNADLQNNVFQWQDGDYCPQPAQLKESHMEACSPLRMHDFMNGSEVGYVCSFTALALMPLLCILIAYIIAKYKEHNVANRKPTTPRRRSIKYKNDAKLGMFSAAEWQGEKQASRNVILRVDDNGSKVHVMSSNQSKLRVVDFSETNCVPVWISNDYNSDMALIYVPREYDLVVRFPSRIEREDFLMYLQGKLHIQNRVVQIREQSRKLIVAQAVTKEKRTQLIERFFKSLFAEALKLDVDMKMDDIKIEQRREIMQCELSKAEFAEALALSPSSSFVDYMFSLLDRDMNGYLSFKELLHVVIMFSKGSPEEKLETLFNMYDTDKNGTLDIAELRGMIRSFLDIANSDLTDEAVEALVTEMFGAAGLSDTSSISFPEFSSVLQHRKLSTVGLDWRGVARSKPAKTKSKGQKNKKEKKASKTQNSKVTDDNANVGSKSPKPSKVSETESLPRSLNDIDFADVVMENQRYHPVKTRLMAFQRYIENNRQRIVILLLFFAFSFGLSIERFYFYTWNQEHVGLRRFATIGVSFSRGAAAGMSFTYSFILLTMCRNVITRLRETFVNLYIPFDSHVAFHKVVAWTALFFTAVHVVGYGFNLYHIVTQPYKHLCMVKEFGFRTDPPPGIAFWAFQTLAGFTGVLLILVLSIIYVFATQTARKYIFSAFWTSHKLYYLMYLLTFLHGATRLVQNPYFWYYFIGPGILYTLDMMVSLSESKKKISVIRADLLPSRVMCLEFKRPPTFEYKSGQWVRIACLEQGENEYHPFTLTSSPHEETLSVHIRSVGPWTNNLRDIFHPDHLKNKPYPKLYIDGPYGAGQQDWYKYECSVLVGGGIGVTPYASILKDFVYMASSRHSIKLKCEKVYFIWVTASQRHFEWLIDILKQVEDLDEHHVVQNHIFITQFFQNFDFRTAMLYLCEEQFQKLSHKSLFTGLRAKTHFGRPQFDKFLSAVSEVHPKVQKVGVFSCGPPGLTKGVEKACFEASKNTKALFEHHYENF